MRVETTELPEVLLLEPRTFADDRGSFSETWKAEQFSEAVGRDVAFVQDNHSISAPGVLRGIHYQVRHAQGKLVRVVAGAVVDVVVDLRRSSPRFGQWVARRLDAQNRFQLWVPEGFGHGFLALSGGAEVLYKVTDIYSPADERTIVWDDPDLAIDWTNTGAPLLSPKDAAGVAFRDAEVFE